MQNRRFHFTDIAIRSLPFHDSTTYVWDGHSTLGLRIGKRSKTFLVITPNGKRVTIGRYPRITLQQARLRINSAHSAPSTAPALSAVLDQFLKAHAAKTRPLTQRNTSRLLHKHLASLHAGKPIDQITTTDLTNILDGLLRTPAEANSAHAKITAFFAWCVRRKIIPVNPLSGVPMPAKINRRSRVLSDVELKQILKTALRNVNPPYYFGVLVLILAYCGLRRMEAYQLTWSRITPRTITIPAANAKNHTELVLPNTIGGYLAAIPKTGDALFPLPINWNNAKRKFDVECGVKNWVLSDLRRKLSTSMAEWEICSIDTTEAILNHTGTRNPIQRTYDRATRFEPMRKALSAYTDRLDALIKSG